MKRHVLRSLQLFILFILTVVTFLLFVITWILGQFPSDKEIRGCFTTKMYQVYVCPQDSNYVRLNDISIYLQKSLVLTEDSTFWTHHGFDFDEIEKSLKKNMQSQKFARGGSTLTQQLSKNLFLTKEKTILRKIKEALITIRIEKTLSKKEILERYLNVVQFGKNLFGIKKASDFYFHKSPKSLTLVESAFLTFLLPNPEGYSKSFFKKELTPFASKRLHQIIDNLFQYQRISEQEYLQAQIELSDFLKGPKVENQKPTDSQFDDTEEDPNPEDI